MYAVVRANGTSGPWVVVMATEWDIRNSRADVLATFTRRRDAERAARRANTPGVCWRCGERVETWDGSTSRPPESWEGHISGFCDEE